MYFYLLVEDFVEVFQQVEVWFVVMCVGLFVFVVGWYVGGEQGLGVVEEVWLVCIDQVYCVQYCGQYVYCVGFVGKVEEEYLVVGLVVFGEEVIGVFDVVFEFLVEGQVGDL